MTENKEEGDLSFSALVVFGQLYHPEVENPRKFFKFTMADISKDLLHIDALEPVDVELFSDGAGEDDTVLIYSGACRIGSCLYFVGGLRRHAAKDVGVIGYDDDGSNAIWCIDTAAATASGSLCSKTIACPPTVDPYPLGYLMPLVVPYDGKILIFCDKCQRCALKIYDPLLNQFSARTIPVESLHEYEVFDSYFLWNDPRKPLREKPLIMLCSNSLLSRTVHLRAFNYELNQWETYDHNFPVTSEKLETWTFKHLIPLEYGSSSLLLIILQAGIWSLYDLFSKSMVMEELNVAGLPLDREVPHAFAQQCYDGSTVVHIFLDGERDEWPGKLQYIAYAKVSLQSEGDKFSATLLSQCSIETGFYVQSYMFVEDSFKSAAKDKETTEMENAKEEE
ncbi:unnamed protein product [Cuscuta epithymum]|uniref:DUF1618 domain-containing protein n=2 Tax=Cuscuta epithymum TaxID=186058 RepID=A0AAV0E982_9ASTE|nr:unnamed protein product [Cuscuta epithymum]CAH9139242.1 unnamed protein product [Cuscuta epithymum]